MPLLYNCILKAKKAVTAGKWYALGTSLDGTESFAYLLSKVHTSQVRNKDPADHCSKQGNRPGDPELVTVAQVVQPHHNTDGTNFASSC